MMISSIQPQIKQMRMPVNVPNPVHLRFGCDCGCGISNTPTTNTGTNTTTTAAKTAEPHGVGGHLAHHAHCIGLGLLGAASLAVAWLLLKRKKGN